ncbi:MAG: DUF3016 domain-containing protein [Verrucomicrobia bacterium]|jgi:hypothetical protein|nr:DUF3016 domain-containing protein [Verrucomicrobiota bacterium]
MKHKPNLSLLLLGIVLLPSPAALGQEIKTSFENVQDYRDFSVSGLSEEKSLKIFKAELANALPRLERRFLPEGLQLHITFTDIDMAGDIQPWRNLHNADIRYVERIYPPRLKFTYKLTNEKGEVLRNGKESISDLAFQMNAAASVRANSETFFYETTLLKDWVRQTFRDLKRPKE